MNVVHTVMHCNLVFSRKFIVSRYTRQVGLTRGNVTRRFPDLIEFHILLLLVSGQWVVAYISVDSFVVT